MRAFSVRVLGTERASATRTIYTTRTVWAENEREAQRMALRGAQENNDDSDDDGDWDVGDVEDSEWDDYDEAQPTTDTYDCPVCGRTIEGEDNTVACEDCQRQGQGQGQPGEAPKPPLSPLAEQLLKLLRPEGLCPKCGACQPTHFVGCADWRS